MRLLLHFRAEELPEAGDDRRGGLARYVSDLLVKGWRSDLPGGKNPVYSFSNLFPPGEVRPGERRRLLIASPNPEVVRALSRRVARAEEPLRVHGMAFRPERHEIFSVQVERAGILLTTATPILLRVPPEDGRGGPVYWEPPIPDDVFIRALNRELIRRFNTYHATRLDEGIPVIAGGRLLRATRSGRTPSSYWEFHTGRLNATAQRVMAFSIDSGFGERIRQGFGFVNVSRRFTPGA
ncbi:CRISPR associated protein Cas6 [anaerobic digester metagenome]